MVIPLCCFEREYSGNPANRSVADRPTTKPTLWIGLTYLSTYRTTSTRTISKFLHLLAPSQISRHLEISRHLKISRHLEKTFRIETTKFPMLCLSRTSIRPFILRRLPSRTFFILWCQNFPVGIIQGYRVRN